MPLKPQVCPISDILLAAQTIASVMCWSNPLISFLYSRDHPPLVEVPCGKPELLSISLYQTLISGLVLTVDDDDQKCVGVAVWTGPVRKRFPGKVAGWCILAILYLWLFINMFYYGLRGNRMNSIVKFLYLGGWIIEKDRIWPGFESNTTGDPWAARREEYLVSTVFGC